MTAGCQKAIAVAVEAAEGVSDPGLRGSCNQRSPRLVPSGRGPALAVFPGRMRLVNASSGRVAPVTPGPAV